MKKTHFIKQLEEEQKKRKKGVTLWDGVLVFVALVPARYALMSSFVYFFSNYYIYALGLIFCLGIVIYFLKKRYHLEWKAQRIIWIGVLIGSMSFLLLPQWMHFYVLEKKQICIDAKLVQKRKYGRSKDNKRMIKFDINYTADLPRQLLGFSKLKDIPDYQYDTLPPVGSPIRICGELSKVGFQYTSIKAVKSGNDEDTFR